jgi:hypothetical protein
MKKIIALLMVCGFAFAFVACGGGSDKAADNADTTEVETPAAPDTTVNDTTVNDTTQTGQ